MLILGFSPRFRYWLQLSYAFLKIHVLWYCFYYALCVVKSWFHILLLTTVMFLPNSSSQILKLFKWRLDLSGVDWSSLIPSDSVFSLKLIFTAHWNKFASSIKKLLFLLIFPSQPHAYFLSYFKKEYLGNFHFVTL